MAVHDYPSRPIASMGTTTLVDKFEIIKEVGDGSFGSVHLARVRTAGAHIAKRGTMVAIKTMKKTFDSLAPCLELREVVFLRSLPIHAHLVPALDIFLDPTTKKLHIAMEYMDGNLYQLMKARDHRCLDGASVKSILYQILSGLDHIHTNNFFHRDIKPENILISTSAPQDSSISFRRYSAIVTPPSTPPAYTVKIADFGLARETHSKLAYTTYVSTRWYRAPEVLLRAGEYSAPVDMWALGAMAVEIATLKPLFPGGNEVDQVWRVCEIMGNPGNWYTKTGQRVGGGEWRDGTKLAQKLGFSFPKMAPHAMDTILQAPQWPAAFANFVTWCLMWDPRNRPTSFEAMQHEFFADAVDPLKPRTRLLNKKQSTYEPAKPVEPTLTSRSSWFRKSLIGRDSMISPSPQPQPQPQPQPLYAPQAPPQPPPHLQPIHQYHQPNTQLLSPRPSPPIHQHSHPGPIVAPKVRPSPGKRATWANGPTPSVGAPMPVLPSIRPVSPLSSSVTVQAHPHESVDKNNAIVPDIPSPEKKKLGRQLSVASHGNHYNDIPSANVSGLSSPTTGQKESFFAHLRKRARRLSGRNQGAQTPQYEDVEAQNSVYNITSNRSSMMIETIPEQTAQKSHYSELDKALQKLENRPEPVHPSVQLHRQASLNLPYAIVKRTSSLSGRSVDDLATTAGPISSRTRRALHASVHPTTKYETPDEQDELLDEALHGANKAVNRMNKQKQYTEALSIKDNNRQSLRNSVSVGSISPYPTPSPSAKRNGILFNQTLMNEPVTPMKIVRARGTEQTNVMWPTPPYEENEWAANAAASIFAAGSAYR